MPGKQRSFWRRHKQASSLFLPLSFVIPLHCSLLSLLSCPSVTHLTKSIYHTRSQDHPSPSPHFCFLVSPITLVLSLKTFLLSSFLARPLNRKQWQTHLINHNNPRPPQTTRKHFPYSISAETVASPSNRSEICCAHVVKTRHSRRYANWRRALVVTVGSTPSITKEIEEWG